MRDEGGISCGELLRRAREERGLTLQQIVQVTKIPLRHLNALERDEFSVLPSGMYRRAEVRAYADAVGLDRNVALTWLDRALEEAMPPTGPRVHVAEPAPAFASNRTRGSIAGGLALATIAIALAMWPRQPGAATTPSSRSSDAPVSAPASSAVPAPTPPAEVMGGTAHSNVEPASQPPRGGPEPTPLALASEAPPRTAPPEETAAAVPRAEPLFTVITEPVGARVTVNDVGWGVTPVTIRYLSPGTKRVRVTREGYQAEERFIEVEAGGPTTTLRIPMRSVD
jgi:transcriptional regulator with XRE-family HTH domain